MSNGVIVTDAQGVITHINRRSKKYLQIDAAIHVGRPIAEVLPMTGGLILQCLETGRTIWGHQASDKNAKIVLNVTPILKDRNIIGAICTFIDAVDNFILAGLFKASGALPEVEAQNGPDADLRLADRLRRVERQLLATHHILAPLFELHIDAIFDQKFGFIPGGYQIMIQ